MFGVLVRRQFSVSSRVPAASRQNNRRPNKSGPNPLAFLALGALSFGALSYIVKARESDPEKEKREKRIPYPNPLVPPTLKKE
ncbi:UMP/CMP kinase [Malassezia equina]|uniref:UMP/CMP kinase n=1 Tax=Malassezia equina TaxID=1381935 RepID=A0AAF0EBQ7_9BASI|nr:UMP/CMP kinase [Malassezia equina]